MGQKWLEKDIYVYIQYLPSSLLSLDSMPAISLPFLSGDFPLSTLPPQINAIKMNETKMSQA